MSYRAPKRALATLVPSASCGIDRRQRKAGPTEPAANPATSSTTPGSTRHPKRAPPLANATTSLTIEFAASAPSTAVAASPGSMRPSTTSCAADADAAWGHRPAQPPQASRTGRHRQADRASTPTPAGRRRQRRRTARPASDRTAAPQRTWRDLPRPPSRRCETSVASTTAVPEQARDPAMAGVHALFARWLTRINARPP